mmetsp:Transcript_88958/g.153804  ORF Transcript_88958/g.153804 Transcript_88958/m.153804 type:complete len:208 (-) Transcript_88958:1172-1795(-)
MSRCSSLSSCVLRACSSFALLLSSWSASRSCRWSLSSSVLRVSSSSTLLLSFLSSRRQASTLRQRWCICIFSACICIVSASARSLDSRSAASFASVMASSTCFNFSASEAFLASSFTRSFRRSFSSLTLSFSFSNRCLSSLCNLHIHSSSFLALARKCRASACASCNCLFTASICASLSFMSLCQRCSCTLSNSRDSFSFSCSNCFS